MGKQTWDLGGRTAFITGAARGIGAESAKRLAARGMKVALVGLEPELLERSAAACGPDAIAIEADVRDLEAPERAAAETEEKLGGIDVVIANAGIAGFGTVRTTDIDAFERTIEINLLGVWRTVRATLPYVIERQGYVLNIASLAAVLQAPGLGAYCMSKAGVEAFTRSLATEVRHLGVRAGVGYFSFMDTDMVADGFEHGAARESRAATPGPIGKVYPLSMAIDAIERGVQKRARIVAAPPLVRGLIALRGITSPFADLGNPRAMEQIVRVGEAEVTRVGAEEASLPPRARSLTD